MLKADQEITNGDQSTVCWLSQHLPSLSFLLTNNTMSHNALWTWFALSVHKIMSHSTLYMWQCYLTVASWVSYSTHIFLTMGTVNHFFCKAAHMQCIYCTQLRLVTANNLQTSFLLAEFSAPRLNMLWSTEV